MKELIIKPPIKIDKQETRIVYVYENGKQIDKFEIKVNCNDNLCINKLK